MKFVEIQEGKDAMRAKPKSLEYGVTSECPIRLADACATGTIVLGDSWFGSVKVCGPSFASLYAYAYVDADC